MSRDTPPTKEGESFSIDSKKVYQLNITNHTSEEQKITFGSNAGLANKPLSFPTGKKEIIERSFISVLKGKINDSTKSYESATEEEKKEMFTFTHEAGEQQAGWSAEELTDYRYIGTTPNNYVTFNDELWRMIGVFTVEDENGKKEKRIKLIRNETIGEYSFDNEQFSRSNNWSTSPLQKVLNSGVYYNRENGSCPYGEDGNTVICDFNNNGLTVESKNMIANTKWYLGGYVGGYSHDENEIASQAYEYERGTTVYSGRPTSWIGKVGLMYPSDYGYAASGSECLNTALSLYDYHSNCKNTDWLSNSSLNQWSITPVSNSSELVFMVLSTGKIDSSDHLINNYMDVRPSVYLKSSVSILSGDGSRENPYTLAM